MATHLQEVVGELVAQVDGADDLAVLVNPAGGARNSTVGQVLAALVVEQRHNPATVCRGVTESAQHDSVCGGAVDVTSREFAHEIEPFAVQGDIRSAQHDHPATLGALRM
mgnify:CR=1 FL=1